MYTTLHPQHMAYYGPAKVFFHVALGRLTLLEAFIQREAVYISVCGAPQPSAPRRDQIYRCRCGFLISEILLNGCPNSGMPNQ